MKKKIVWLPYDFDTAIGTNNEGALVFSYNLEDTDKTETGADVYNGQNSLMWCNLRDTHQPELRAMYQSLRSTGILSYETVERMFEEHQAKWPIAIRNEDYRFKYIDPLINDGNASYLSMLQGSKKHQRKWWLKNRFRYLDSKYNAGDALTQVITLRGYSKSDITVTPYYDIYPSIKYGSVLVQKRGARNIPTTLPCPLDNVNDTETYIYSADQIKSIGDISDYMVGYADFSMAVKLQELKIGDASETYSNYNLKELYLGNNKLLKNIDVRNCPNLNTSVDLSGCSNIEEIHFEGTSITGLGLPNGGVISSLHLPDSMTNLTIRNQSLLEDFSIGGYSNLTTLRLENVGSGVDTKTALLSTPDNARVRLVGFYWEATNSVEIDSILNKMDKMRGLDINGDNLDSAYVDGTIHTSALTGAEIADYNQRYPYLKVVADHTTSYLYYYNYDGTSLLYAEAIQDGGDGVWNGTPSRAATPQNIFTFIGWNTKPNQTTADANATKNVVADRAVYAAYSVQGQVYRVRFYVGNELKQTVNNVPYGGSATYTGETPTKEGDYVFSGWSPSPTNITGNTDCYAQFADLSSAVIKYLRRTLDKYESDVNTIIAPNALSNMPSLDSVSAPIISIGSGAFDNSNNITKIYLTSTNAINIPANAFSGKSKLTEVHIKSTSKSTLANVNAFSGTPMVILGGAIYVPDNLVSAYKADSTWKQLPIYGESDYPVSDFSSVSDTWAEIAASSRDGSYKTKYSIGDIKKLTRNNNTYYARLEAIDAYDKSDGSGKAPMMWLLYNFRDTHNMNSTNVTTGDYPGSAMHEWVNNTWAAAVEDDIKNNVVPVNITYRSFADSETKTMSATWFIPSYYEVFGESSNYEDSGVRLTNFTAASNRIKYNNNASASNWWLRSATSATSFANVNSSGNANNNNASSSNGVVVGFCI